MIGKVNFKVARPAEQFDPTLEKCARCSKPLQPSGNWSDEMVCEQCGKLMCDKCAREAMCGDDSYPYLLCPGCLSGC